MYDGAEETSLSCSFYPRVHGSHPLDRVWMQPHARVIRPEDEHTIGVVLSFSAVQWKPIP